MPFKALTVAFVIVMIIVILSFIGIPYVVSGLILFTLLCVWIYKYNKNKRDNNEDDRL